MIKMTKKFDDLNDTFNVEGEVVSTEIQEVKSENLTPTKPTVDDITKDYEYTRGNLYSLI